MTAIASIEDCVRALNEGVRIVVPTEAGYVVASRRDGSVRLVGGAADVVEDLAVTHPTHRRLIEQFSPGPMVWVRRGDADDRDRSVDRRCWATEAAAPFLDDGIVRADLLEDVGLGSNVQPGASVADEVLLDEGRVRYPKGPTVVRLLDRGGIRVERTGVFEERYIRKFMMLQVLFVCTGNTCRSPMAEALARDLVEQDPAMAAQVAISSAGASTLTGLVASREAIDVLKGMGIELSNHRSRELTRDLIASSDVIFTMTSSHRRAVLAADPTASDRVHLLDPSGEDIADPIGQPEAVYRETAARLRELIEGRLKELMP